MMEIGLKVVREIRRNACLSLFLLVPISFSINLCQERYIYMSRGKKNAVVHARIAISGSIPRLCRGRFCCTSCRTHGALTVHLTESDRKSIRLSMKTVGYTAAGISNVGARQLCRARRLARNRFTTLLPRFCSDYESVLSLSLHPLRRFRRVTVESQSCHLEEI